MKNAPYLRAFTLFYLLFLYSPILLLPIFAFNDGKVVAFPLQGFTTEMVRRDVRRPESAQLRPRTA